MVYEEIIIKANIKDFPQAYRFESGTPGEEFIVVGSIHGNEPVGADIIEYCVKNEIKPEQGSVTYIMGNFSAYIENVRGINGGNMNREFGKFSNTIEGKRAKEISDYIWKVENPRIMDIHTTSTDTKPFTAYNKDCEISRMMSQYANVKTTLQVNKKEIPGLLIYEAPGFAVECGQHASTKAFDFALKTMHNMFIEGPKYEPENIYKPVATIPGGTKFVKNFVSGTEIKANQVIGYFTDKSGNKQEVKYKHDGIIFIPDHNSHPNDYDAGMIVERVE